MKVLLLSLSLLSYISVSAQFEIDPYMMEEGWFEDVNEAAKTPDKVIYLALSMQHPKWKEVPPVVFSFQNLKRLDLSFNQVAHVADGISQLQNLEYLNLEGNHYLTTISDEIAKLPKLTELNLIDARIPAADLARIKEILPNCKVVTNR